MAQYHQQLKSPSPQRSLGEFAERRNPYCLKDRPKERLRPELRQLLSRARLSGVTVEALAKLLVEEERHWNAERDAQS